MRNKGILVKVTENEHNLIKERAKQLGFSSVGDYIRYISLTTTKIERNIYNHKEIK